jgi:hypothetical protein
VGAGLSGVSSFLTGLRQERWEVASARSPIVLGEAAKDRGLAFRIPEQQVTSQEFVLAGQRDAAGPDALRMQGIGEVHERGKRGCG